MTDKLALGHNVWKPGRGRADRAKLTYGLLLGLVIATGLAGAAHPAFAEENASTPPKTASPGKASGEAPGGAGMVIHVDPVTGAILREPAPGSVPLQLGPQLRNALSTSHQGLVETPNLIVGGGIMVDLQGRFQSPTVVTIDAAGSLKMHHDVGGAPAFAHPHGSERTRNGQ